MKVYIKSSLQHGRGVFARDQIRAGEPILTFSGPLLNRAEVREEDYHLQVDADLYLGASGEADDYVNHSCDRTPVFAATSCSSHDAISGRRRRSPGITARPSTRKSFRDLTVVAVQLPCRGAVPLFPSSRS